MANIYFEIADCLLERNPSTSKYYVVHTEGKDYHPRLSMNMQMSSERIWREDSTGVRFVKNRYNIDYTAVDLKEFMWVKLSSKVIE